MPANTYIICSKCEKECEGKLFCSMCGSEPTGEEVDMQFCRDCKDHTDFEELSDCCGAETKEIQIAEASDDQG